MNAEERNKRNQEYWRKREEDALNHYIKDEKAHKKKLDGIYSEMLDNVQKEIDGFYGRYAGAEGITLAEAKKRVSRLDIEAYERKAKRYVRDKTFTEKANAEMRLYNATMKINRLEMLKANIGLELLAGHSDLEKFMEDVLRGRTEDELERMAGILGETIVGNAKAANAIVNASFHNAKFSDRIWQNQNLLKLDLEKLLQTGLIQGRNPRVLARELEKRFGVSQYNAERLMRTELARVQTEAQKLSFERNGFDMYTFHALAEAAKFDCNCSNLDGRHFKISEMVVGENAPPLHPHCRCSVSAYSDRKEYEEWLDFLAAGGTTEEYNKMKAGGEAKKAPKTKAAKLSPAKARQQAEEYARSKGVKYVDYSKLPPETVDLLNKALDTLPDDVRPLFMGDSRSLEKLWGGKLPRSSKNFYGVTMQAGGYIPGDHDAFGYMVGISNSYKTADAIATSKKETNKRYQQRHNGHSWFFNVDGETTPYHEMGHVYANEKGLPEEFEFAATKWAIDTKCDMLTNPNEAWAEAWAAYHTGKNELPGYIRKYIEDAANK